MDDSRPAPVSLTRRIARRVRAVLQRIVVPDYAQFRAEVAQHPGAIHASLDLGRALAARVEALEGKYDILRRRQEELAEDIAAIDALSWDRAALARRLAQIEDRLIALVPEPGVDEGETGRWPPVRFPGLDRYEDRIKARQADSGEAADACGNRSL